VGSEAIAFSSGVVRPGDYFFDIGTAGATALVLQTLLLPPALGAAAPVSPFAKAPHVPWSPAIISPSDSAGSPATVHLQPALAGISRLTRGTEDMCSEKT
jgi:hypothetical protein